MLMHLLQIFCILFNAMPVKPARMEGFIVGGVSASIDQHPHSAFMNIDCIKNSQGTGQSFVCGASIINQQMLLTAAHCFDSCIEGTVISINMGDSSRYKGATRYASGFLHHENFDPVSGECDLGVVKMSKPVPLNGRISRVGIMPYPPYDEPGTVAGWGMINEQTKTYSPVLKATDQTVWSYSDCVQMLGEMPDGTMCASSEHYNDYVSSGDSGSALVVRGYIQIGLVSYKTSADDANIAVYTDVGFHYDWIEENVKKLYCNNTAR